MSELKELVQHAFDKPDDMSSEAYDIYLKAFAESKEFEESTDASKYRSRSIEVATDLKIARDSIGKGNVLHKHLRDISIAIFLTAWNKLHEN